MGAAGLTSSSFEMAARGEAGIELDLDRVPLRETGMTPYEIMLSESQERMLMVLEDGREAEALAIFAKWGLDCAVIGRVTDTGRMVLRWQGGTVADVPVAPVSGASPVYDRPCGAHAPARAAGRQRPRGRAARTARRCCASWARPTSPASAGSGSSTTTWSWPTRCSARAATPPWSASTAPTARLALTTDCTPRYCFADPRHGRPAGRGRGLAQPGCRRRPAAGDHQLPQFRQSRAAAGHGPAGRLHRGHGRGLHGRSTSRSCRATSRSTTRPTATRSCPRPMSAASA